MSKVKQHEAGAGTSASHGPTGFRRLPWEIIAPTAAALVVGLWGLTSAGLWIDERDTLLAADYPLWRLWELPLLPYYGVMWVWTLGGSVDSDFWMRLLSVLAMSAAVLATAVTARRVAGRRASLAAGVAMVLVPSISRYAQEARVYAIATLLTSIATWLVVWAISSNRRGTWIGYGASLAAIGIFAPFALSIVLGHAVVVLSNAQGRALLTTWLKACLVLIPVVVLDLFLFTRFGFMHQWATPPDIADLPTGLFFMTGSAAIGAALIAFTLMSREGLAWLLGAIVAVASVWLVSVGPSSFWQERSLVPLVPLLVIGAGIGMSHLPRWGFVGATLLLVVIALPILDAQRQPGARGLDPRAVARIVDQEGRPGDVINTAINNWLSWGIEHYLPEDPRFTFAPSSTGRAWVLDDAVPCTRLAEYQVPPEGFLVLCESLPEGWENMVVRE